MPFPNEHAVRLKDPGDFKRFRRQKNKGGSGVDFIFGITPEGKTELQAIRFAKNNFTVEQAKAWLAEHKMSVKMFEPAVEKKEDSSAEYILDEFRYDKGEIKSSYFDQDGFLVVDAIVTRTGVFNYRNNDGSLRRELRHPDDILKRDSLRTLSMLPITLLHPPEKKVDPMNSARLSKGFTGEDVQVDGKYVRTKLKICDQSAIDAVIGGMREISLGYTVALVEEDGEYMGENYDFRQTEVTYNHLAIVPSARAGAEARIVLDRTDAVQCLMPTGGTCPGNCSTCSYAINFIGQIKLDATDPTNLTNQNNQPTNKENRQMKKINIDGIEYEAAPEVINRLTKETTRADEAEKALKSANDATTVVQAKLDEADAKIKTLESRDDAAEIQKAVDTRLNLIAIATPHLDEETVKKVTTMTEKDIKIAVIKKHYPEANLDGKDDVYINARFDGAIELKPKTTDENISSQRQNLNGNPANRNDKNEIDQDKSRENMVNDMTDAWKKPQGEVNE